MTWSVKTHTSVLVDAKGKGGVGGSLTCIFLAFEYAKRGANVLVIDADPVSQTAHRWHGDAEATNPDDAVPFLLYPYDSRHGTLVGTGVAMAKEHQLDLIIYDLGADTKSALNLAKFADVMLGPTGPTLDERAPCTALYNAVRSVAPDTPWVTLLTRVPDPGRGAAAQARAILEADGLTVAATEIKRVAERYSDQSGTLVTDTHAYADLADELNPYLKRPWTRKES